MAWAAGAALMMVSLSKQAKAVLHEVRRGWWLPCSPAFACSTSAFDTDSASCSWHQMLSEPCDKAPIANASRVAKAVLVLVLVLWQNSASGQAAGVIGVHCTAWLRASSRQLSLPVTAAAAIGACGVSTSQRPDCPAAASHPAHAWQPEGRVSGESAADSDQPGRAPPVPSSAAAGRCWGVAAAAAGHAARTAV